MQTVELKEKPIENNSFFINSDNRKNTQLCRCLEARLTVKFRVYIGRKDLFSNSETALPQIVLNSAVWLVVVVFVNNFL